MALDDATLREILRTSRTIAVVGMSEKPDRDSHQIGAYLIEKGYNVIPINPAVPSVLGRPSYPNLSAVPRDVTIDIVDVFRKSEAVPEIVTEALQRQPLPKLVWLQLTITSEPGRRAAEARGVPFLEDSCIRVQHRRLLGPG